MVVRYLRRTCRVAKSATLFCSNKSTVPMVKMARVTGRLPLTTQIKVKMFCIENLRRVKHDFLNMFCDRSCEDKARGCIQVTVQFLNFNVPGLNPGWGLSVWSCMFSLCTRGFFAGTPTYSHSAATSMLC